MPFSNTTMSTRDPIYAGADGAQLGLNRDQLTLTAPLAIIMIGDTPIGKMQNFTFTENYNRVPIREIGNVLTIDLPIISFEGTFNAAAAVISIDTFGNVPSEFFPSGLSTAEEWANAMTLGRVRFDITLFMRLAVNFEGATRASGFPDDPHFEGTRLNYASGDDIDWEELGTIEGAVLESRSITIANDQISMQNITGRYLKPIRAVGTAKPPQPPDS